MASQLVLGLALSALLQGAHALNYARPRHFLQGSTKEDMEPEICALDATQDPEEASVAAEAGEQVAAVWRQQVLTHAKLVFVVHRKTGFILTGRIAKCINAVAGEGTVQSAIFPPTEQWFTEGSPRPAFVHMARDPVDLLLSSYLYDKITSTEKGTLGEGTALKFKKRIQRNLYNMSLAESRSIKQGNDTAFMQLTVNESLRDFLVRAPPETGLRATLGYSWSKMAHVDAGRENCIALGDTACVQVYLNFLMSSSEAFMQTMTNIMELAGIDATPEIMDCVAEQDTHGAAFANSSYSKHCSTQDVTHEEREHYRDLLLEVDSAHYHGVYQAMSAKWQADAMGDFKARPGSS